MSSFFKVAGGLALALAMIIAGAEPTNEAIDAGRQWIPLILSGGVAVIGLFLLWVGYRTDRQEEEFFQ